MNMAIAMNVIYTEEVKRAEAAERHTNRFQPEINLEVPTVEVVQMGNMFTTFLNVLFGRKSLEM